MRKAKEFILPGYLNPTNFGLERILTEYGLRLLRYDHPVSYIISFIIFMFPLAKQNEILNNLKDKGLLSEKSLKIIINKIESTKQDYTIIIDFNKDIGYRETDSDYSIYIIEILQELKHLTEGAEKRLSCFNEQLKDFLGLSDEEAKIIDYCLAVEYYPPLRAFIGEYTNTERIYLMSLLTDINVGKLRIVLCNGDLIKKKIISVENSWMDLFRLEEVNYFSLNENLKYAIEIGDIHLATSNFYIKKEGKVFDLNSFPVAPFDKNTLCRILSEKFGCNILIYGPPGTGKTEYARSLCREVNVEPYFLASGHSGENEQRLDALRTVSAILRKGGNPLIIDDADALISGPRFLFSLISPLEKSWLNEFMESVTFPVIWIVNSIKGIDEAAIRRFTYTLCFEQTSTKQRLEMFKEKVDDKYLSFFTESDVNRLVAKYPVPISKISEAIQVAVAISDDRPEENILAIVENILGQYQRIVTGKEVDKVNNHENYNPDILNTDIPFSDIEKAVKSYSDSALDDKTGDGLIILFHGDPGTGKTAFAEYLARENNLELIRRDASDILGSYVGETERNISRIFIEGEQEKTLLLIDEADSFLAARISAHRQYEISRTNQFLTSIERYKGILICSTNLLSNLDHAVLRRFSLKVRFNYLNQENLGEMFKLYFPQVIGNLEILSFLKGEHKLTPGDFSTVSKSMKFKQGNIKAEDIVEQLKIEESYRNGSVRIGF